MNKLVIKLTGKLFDKTSLLKKYVDLFRELGKKYKLVIVTGGGNTARKYIETARKIGVESNYWLDTIGIIASRLNSYLLISSLYPDAYPKPVEDLEELCKAINYARVLIVGGLIPGQSTSSVALEVAEAIGVKSIVNVSAVDYVYDKDPVKYPDAKKYIEIKASHLIKILEQKQLPGEYALIDIRALELAIRSGIIIYNVYYRDPGNVVKVLNGENPGTIIYPE